MNKRQFLLGLSATVAATLTPAMIEVVVNAAPAVERTFSHIFPSLLLLSIWAAGAVLLVRAGWNR